MHTYIDSTVGKLAHDKNICMLTCSLTGRGQEVIFKHFRTVFVSVIESTETAVLPL